LESAKKIIRIFDPRRKREISIFPLFLVFVFPTITACSNKNTSPANTLTTVIATPIQSLNPLYGTDANSQHVNELLHSSLITIGDNLMPVPYLAKEMKLIDPLTIEFTLREGCKFPSGRNITSDDVEKSLRYFQDPKNLSPFAETFSVFKKFEKIDSLRFRFISEKPTPGILTDLDILKILDLDSIKEGEKPNHLIGAGAYQLEEFSPALIAMRRTNQPCLPTPPMEKIVVKVVRDDLSRFFKLKTGEVDVVLNEMNYRKIEVIQNDPNSPLTASMADGIGYSYLGLNLANEKLRNPDLRRALALSLDLPSVIKYKSRGLAKQARNILADQNYFANLSVPIMERNIPEAKKLLDKAGYFNGENKKPPLKLSLKTNTSTISVENARVLAAQAKDSGILIEHQANDWGIFYNDVKTGNTEIYLLRWIGVTDPRIYYDAFHSKEIGKGNRTRFQNSEIDRLTELGEITVNPEERKKIYLQVQDIVAKELPYIGLWYGKNVAVHRKNIKNVRLHPAGKWITLLEMKKE
jgi:peptide/nickel transport system substrate-binding protein